MYPQTDQAPWQWAEALACTYLKKQGLSYITKNFRTKLGEIDIIMQDPSGLVFVEVRYRRSAKWGSPAATVAYTKQQRLIRTALIYLQRFDNNPPPCRFDVVSIDQEKNIDWIKAAFELVG